MLPSQRFRLDNEIESLALRQDANGLLYSQMTDILDIFPSALRFKLNGINILFLEHEHGQRLAPEDNVVVSMSTLSLRPHNPTVSHALIRSLAPSHSVVPRVAPTQLLERPMTVLSTIASDITQIHQKLNRSTDRQSVYHQQLLERLVQLLQEHAEAKERDERVLAELAAAKECGEEMLRMQKQTIDRLI
ncbi:hypothetical protein BGX29_000789, partial [Mortierella sp. GBA35]